MSLPKYVVNWEELLDILGDKLDINIDNLKLGDLEGLLKGNLETIVNLLKEILKLLYDKGVQCISSLRQHIPAVVGVYKLTKTFDVDVMLTGITYSQTGWKYQDSWDLEIDGKLLFEVFTKELGEHKNFNVFYYVPAGTPINILYHNDSGNSRIVWFDIEYLNLALPNRIPEPPNPTEPEIPEVPPGEKPPILVCPAEIIEVGIIEIPENNIEDLVVSMEFATISGTAFPDINIKAPNGDKFGYQETYLSDGDASETMEASSAELATYTGFLSHPETFTFKKPIGGKWIFYAQSFGGDIPSLVRFECSHPYKLTYKEHKCPGFEDYELEPFPD